MDKVKKKDLKWFFACGKPFFQKWWLFLILGFVVLTIPILINGCYLFGNETGKGFVTLWGARDVLTFYGSFLAFLGTVVLGSLALKQNKALSTIVERNDKANFVSFVNCVPKFDTGASRCVLGPCLSFYDPEKERFREEIETIKKKQLVFCISVKMENLSNHIVSKLSGNVYRGNEKVGDAEKYYCSEFLLKPGETQDVILLIKILEGKQTPRCDFHNDKADVEEDKSIYIDENCYLYDENIKIKLEFTNVFGLKSFGLISFNDGLGEVEIEYNIENFDL